VADAYVLTSEADGITHEVPGEVIVGRGDGADLRLRDRTVSRRHAELRQEGLTLVVADLSSANGTYVNGERIPDATRVEPGDVISFGAARMLVGLEPRELEEPTPTEIITPAR
jgi:pSer/pThr/pTyr-binding forkhead associated (FHA) protein